MEEAKRYINPEDILGIRITCRKCGVTAEGGAASRIPVTCCDNSWQTGKEGQDLSHNGMTELKHFLNQWKRFTESMLADAANRQFSFAFVIKAEDEKVGKAGK
jgi:hypothetical protein